jgi:hypothetical protein
MSSVRFNDLDHADQVKVVGIVVRAVQNFTYVHTQEDAYVHDTFLSSLVKEVVRNTINSHIEGIKSDVRQSLTLRNPTLEHISHEVPHRQSSNR